MQRRRGYTPPDVSCQGGNYANISGQCHNDKNESISNRGDASVYGYRL